MRVGFERSRPWAAAAPTKLIKEGYFTEVGDQGSVADFTG